MLYTVFYLGGGFLHFPQPEKYDFHTYPKKKNRIYVKKIKIDSIPQISKKEFFPPDFYYRFQQVAKKD